MVCRLLLYHLTVTLQLSFSPLTSSPLPSPLFSFLHSFFSSFILPFPFPLSLLPHLSLCIPHSLFGVCITFLISMSDLVTITPSLCDENQMGALLCILGTVP